MDSPLEKYKALINKEPPKGSLIEISWGTRYSVKKAVGEILKKFHQVIKNYKMVSRLRPSK